MFTYVIIAGVAFTVMSIMCDGVETSSSKEEQVKPEPEFGSYEYVRENLGVAYYSNGDCHDIGHKLRTDSTFRYEVQRNMRYGYSFQVAVECVEKNMCK